MSTSILPCNPGFQIDCRGPRGARQYDFDRAGETAEFAILLRDEGRWRLRFSTGTEAIRAIVAEIDGEAA